MGDSAHAHRQRGVFVELAFLARLLQLLVVGLIGTFLDVLFGHQHLLLALDTNGTRRRGLHGLAACNQQCAAQDTYRKGSKKHFETLASGPHDLE